MEVYGHVVSGELIGTVAATQFPDIPCRMVQFIAETTNTGNVYIGGSNMSTVRAGTTNATAGLQLVAKACSGWIPVTNLNLLYGIADATTDCLTYIAVG